MEVEITPEPDDEEREAIVRALEDVAAEEASLRSAWLDAEAPGPD